MISRSQNEDPRWPWVKLGSFDKDGTLLADGPFGSNLKTEHYRSAGARVVRLQNIGLGKFLDTAKAFVDLSHHAILKRHHVEPGDIVIAALGDGARPAGRACRVPEGFGPGLVKADCFRLRIPPGSAEPDFLVQYFNSPVWLSRISEAMRGATRPRVTLSILAAQEIPAPPLSEQRRVAKLLSDQFSSFDQAKQALTDQMHAAKMLPYALVRDSLAAGSAPVRLGDVLEEITGGVGQQWRSLPLLGASRAGLALAKEPIGKNPERYKPVQPGGIFYNPMRVLLGSIAFVETEAGIVSPDYVAFTTNSRLLNSRWFYHWLRSPSGVNFIKSLARGAVRERILFTRLAEGVVHIPALENQLKAVAAMERVPLLAKNLHDQLAALNHYPSALLRDAFAEHL